MKTTKSFHIPRSLLIAALTITPLAIHADDSQKSQTTLASSSASAKHSELAATDKESIVKNSAKMNLATQKYAELAQQKAQSPELKQFAQTLQQDHQKAQQDLERIAQKHNITLPTSVDEKCQQEVSRLEALSGQEFDREFTKGAVEGHAMAVAHLQKASSAAEDTDVRQYTQQMLSKVKQHQSKGRELAKSIGLNQTEITSLENKAHDAVGGAAASATGTSDSSNKSSNSDSSTDSITQPSDTEKKSDK
jgi:putative membrane protein